jgi:CRP-like cAMP-binding protein
MGRSVSEVLSRAEGDLSEGNYDDALRGFLAVIQAAPRFPRARLRVADTLLNVGQKKRAASVYRALSWHYLRTGQPLLGLVAAKMVIALDPSYQDLLDILAELYSAESDRLGDGDLPPVEPLIEGVEVKGYTLAVSDALYDEAVKVASDTSMVSDIPTKLPPIPLFSHLAEEPFIGVLGSLRLRRFADGEIIICEGQPGDAFFMLADGVVTVSKKVGTETKVLANLSEGAVFGEMALVSNAPRTATVTARGEVALLSLFRADLELQAGELESITQALRKFTRGRFLANLAATSPLFQDIQKDDRRELLRKFQSQVVGAGDILIEEGEQGRGLFLVLRGEFDVTQKELGPRNNRVATLKSGDIFGEISLIKASPTTATVTSRAGGEVLFLARTDFDAALLRHPTLKATLGDLTSERLRQNRQRSEDRTVTDDHALLV